MSAHRHVRAFRNPLLQIKIQRNLDDEEHEVQNVQETYGGGNEFVEEEEVPAPLAPEHPAGGPVTLFVSV